MLKTASFFVLFLIIFTGKAYAYLDYGTGSYVLQLVAATAIGFIFVIKNYLHRIKDFVLRKNTTDKDHTEDTEKQ